MGPVKFIILFGNVDLILYGFFFWVLPLISARFGHIWPYSMQFAQMTATAAFGTNTKFGIMMTEIKFSELLRSISEILV